MNKLVVITTPYFFADEASLIELLFTEGLDTISPAYYDRIVLHDWFTLAEERALGGIHLNKRNPEAPPLYKGSISRSCHSLEGIIEYKPVCDYVLLSPIFQSISKEGYGSGFPLDGLRNAKGIIDDKVIAFGGVAVLGALWGNDPSLLVADQLIKQFKRLQVWP